MSKISVIIVSWNARQHLQNCLASLREAGGGLVREIIVVDNASTDGSPDMVEKSFPEVNLIRTGQNLGFSRANNLGIKLAKGDYLALINSDVVVHKGCFEHLTDYLEKHSDTGLVSAHITGADGLLQRSCRRLPSVWNLTCSVLALDSMFPRTPLFSGFEFRHWDYNQLGEVEVLSGCFWLARRSAVDKVGGLDERYFFYAEDLDWCKTFRDAGWKVMYIPQASAIHFGGGSSANAPLKYSIEMLRANLTYWRKHHGVLGKGCYFLLALLYHSIRFIPRGIKRLISSTRDGHAKVKEHFVCVRWLLTGKGV